MNINRNFTIKDIARLANVSIGTVDRVIHHRGEVSEVTRNRILKIINEYNYKPSFLASTLASKKLYTISVIIPKGDENNIYWDAPMKGIERAEAELKNLDLSLINVYLILMK